MIEGWKDLTSLVGVGRMTIARWIALYNFPKPVVAKDGKAHRLSWDRGEVLAWRERNMELVLKQNARSQRAGWPRIEG